MQFITHESQSLRPTPISAAAQYAGRGISIGGPSRESNPGLYWTDTLGSEVSGGYTAIVSSGDYTVHTATAAQLRKEVTREIHWGKLSLMASHL
jgi:hypothetical protein